MNKIYTNNSSEYLVDDELFDSSDEQINTVLGNIKPGTLIHTAGYARIKELGFDDAWTEVG